MRYIGHLDLLKLFQRAIKRAQLPVAYSAGFNPHQQISFALPLPIGHSSAADYADIEFDRIMSERDIITPLATQMPKGINILSAREFAVGERPAAAQVSAAIYEIRLPGKPKLSSGVPAILAMDGIILPKKTKSGTALTDIRPDIFSLDYRSENHLDSVLAAGSGRNLKPGLLVDYIYTLANEQYDPLAVQYKRADLLRETSNGHVSLNDGVSK